MRSIDVKNSYGTEIKLNVELSEEAKKSLPIECLECCDNPETLLSSSAVCGDYGPCNLYPIIKFHKA